jgi:hypothetical protein
MFLGNWHHHTAPLFLALLAAMLCGMPSSVYADVTIVNPGTSVHSNVSASATSGGNSSSGDTTNTGSASASVKTHIEANGEGGTAIIEIETEENGVVEKQIETRTYEPDEAVDIEVNTTATSADTAAIAGETTEGESEATTSKTTVSDVDEKTDTNRIPSVPALMSWIGEFIVSPVFAFFGWT